MIYSDTVKDARSCDSSKALEGTLSRGHCCSCSRSINPVPTSLCHLSDSNKDTFSRFIAHPNLVCFHLQRTSFQAGSHSEVACRRCGLGSTWFIPLPLHGNQYGSITLKATAEGSLNFRSQQSSKGEGLIGG